jgi:HSP20 family molecular chaperone IbpA
LALPLQNKTSRTKKEEQMQLRSPHAWMLAEAVELLRNADRLHRQFFQIGRPGESPCWEPPVDIYESEHELRLLVALPGVAPERLTVTLEPGAIVVRGERAHDAHLSPGAILRLEIPYGRFERRIGLPGGDYRLVDMKLEHGCVKLHLEKLL